ncbi:MAG: PQQ-binding-like beta-propeller repeat protein, partial [Nanoarchaeota archaeon]
MTEIKKIREPKIREKSHLEDRSQKTESRIKDEFANSSLLPDKACFKNISFEKASDLLLNQEAREVIKLWEFETGDKVYSSPFVVADGVVYVG